MEKSRDGSAPSHSRGGSFVVSGQLFHATSQWQPRGLQDLKLGNETRGEVG